MEKIFSYAWRGKRGIELDENGDENDNYVDDEQGKDAQIIQTFLIILILILSLGLQRKHKVDTTLQVHFFGKKGNQELNFDGFYNFMKNLQTEVSLKVVIHLNVAYIKNSTTRFSS